MRFSTALPVFILGFAIGSIYSVNKTIDLVSAALGWPREEIEAQVEWYLEPVQDRP